MKDLLSKRPAGNWLSGLAIMVAGGTWAALGAWGWTKITEGPVLVLAVTLTLAVWIIGIRALKNAAETTLLRGIALVLLGVACLGWSGYSGHQALTVSEGDRWAAWEAKEAADRAVTEAQAAVDAVPALAAYDDAGRRIGPRTLAVLAGERDKAVASRAQRLAGAQVAAARYVGVSKPATRIPTEILWALAVLVEALEAFGFWALGRAKKTVVAVGDALSPELSPSELGSRLRARRTAKAAVA